MSTKAEMGPLKGIAMRYSRLFSMFGLVFCVFLSRWPATGLAEQESPVANEQKQKVPEIVETKQMAPEAVEQKPRLSEVAELKQKASDAYIHGRYAEAETALLKIAQKFPASKERRYAVQMLGTLYEDNLVDPMKAIKWDREYLKKYADPRQVPFYKEKVDKLAVIEKAANQEEAFKIYHKIKFANKGDAYLVQKYEELLRNHPDFLYKADVERELGYAYARIDKPRKSFAAFQAISSQNHGQKLSSSDRTASDESHRYWKMAAEGGMIAWGVIILLWVTALIMKPWKDLTWASIKKFRIYVIVWLLLVAASLPFFYSMENEGVKFVVHDTMVYTAAALNLTILLWQLLLTRGKYWQTRPRALRWASPLLTLLMTVSVFYLFMAYQPHGPELMDEFASKYRYLEKELHEGRK